MTEENQEDRDLQIRHHQRLARLAADKRRILQLSPEKALDEILDHAQPAALVHSMAEEDFFFLVNEIGPEDALELLSLASNRQWEYILDLETWNRDRINTGALTHWMNLLNQADADRFIRWAMEEKTELLEYCLHEAIEVLVREDDADPGDLPDGFFSYDTVFYVRIRDDFLNAVGDDDTRDQREHLIHRMLERLADEDHLEYQATLLRSANVMPSEAEEESFRLRNVRLAEKGFLPFDEAVGIYAAMRPENVRKRPHKYTADDPEADFTVPVPFHHNAMMTGSTIFSNALWKIEAHELFHELQVEFATLCNQVIAADQRPIRERGELRDVVEKTCGYLSLGLHRLAKTDAPPEASQSASILRTYSLADIFRTGYGLIADLSEQARKWKTRSWYAKNHLALSFFGERLVGHIGGLLLARPKYFDNYETGQLYRDFETLADVADAQTALHEAMAFDEIFSQMGLDTARLPTRHFLTHENLLLTLWAKNRLELEESPEPIPVDMFRPFFTGLWETGQKTPRITDSARSDFLDWLSQATGMSRDTIFEKTGRALEHLFSKIADEYKAVSAQDLDPRFVHLFILKHDKPISP
ncbi:MAG: DUF6178 family protein [Desulfobacterales bacterium]